MATEKKPVRRNDVVHCELCGEDYSVTYKRCPFCDDATYRARGGSGRRVAGNARGGGYGGRVYPIQLVGLVLSLVLIIAAVFIVFTRLAPLFGKEKPKEPDVSAPGTSTSQPAVSTPDSSTPDGSAPDVSSPDAADPGGSQVTPPPAVGVNALTLNQSDFTLKPNESYPITAKVDPAGTTVVWSTSDEKLATITQDGRVTNVNAGANTGAVTITATAGDKTATCVVRCRGGSTAAGGTTAPTTPTTPPATPPATGGASLTAGSRGVITGAGGGLNVRSGPGTSNPAIATITNGVSVTIVADAGDGWYKITFSGTGGKATEGYVSKNFVAAA